MLGVKPVIGRFFDVTEERDESEHVAVLGYEEWRSKFGGEASVLGRTIDVSGVPHTIIGVAPEGFTGIDLNRVDLWLPLGVASRFAGRDIVNPSAGTYWLKIVAKRKASVPVAQVANEVTTAYRDVWKGARRYDETFGKSRAVLGPVVAARGPAANDDSKVSVWVAAVSLLVLLIACANVANLLLLRGLTRSREVALRLSLGATRGRLVRQSLVEGGLLAVAGAVCAIALARWSASAMRAFLLPRAETESVLNLRLLAFTAVVALGTGILASVIPAFVTARRDFGPLLSAGRSGDARNRLVVQRALIGAQVTLAMLLLVGAGLFVASLRNVHAIDLGMDADHLLYVKLDLGSPGEKAGDRGATLGAVVTYETMLESVRRVPGVAKATLTAGEPLTSGWGIRLVRRGGQPPADGNRVPTGRAVGTDYFETMGTALRRGRYFTAADHLPSARAAIIDEATAKQYWPDGNPLDPCVYLDATQTCTEIVGVVENTVLYDITGDRGSIVYVPVESWPSHGVNMMEVRTTGDPGASIDAVRRALLSVSPNLPWVDIQPLNRRLDSQLRPWRLGASMFTAFGVLALGLAAVGSLWIALVLGRAPRARDRDSQGPLGAPAGGVVRMVIRGGLGMTFRASLSAWSSRSGRDGSLRVSCTASSPRDPVVVVLCAAVLVAVAIVACLAPARRATKVDPMITLRRSRGTGDGGRDEPINRGHPEARSDRPTRVIRGARRSSAHTRHLMAAKRRKARCPSQGFYGRGARAILSLATLAQDDTPGPLRSHRMTRRGQLRSHRMTRGDAALLQDDTRGTLRSHQDTTVASI
jgi:predicted permease